MHGRLIPLPALTLGASLFVAAAAILAPAQDPPAADEDPQLAKGRELYKARCMSCHGENGQGGKGYRRPLAGSKTLAELNKYIQENMPPKGKRLSEDESRLVGSFVYETSYSALAQERNRPARIALSRLTVRQHQNALSDLLSDGSTPIHGAPGAGLKADYFKTPWADHSQRLIERVDPTVDFDFKTEGPAKDGFDPYRFGIVWSGSLTAPDTGEYDLIVKSNQSVVLHLNDAKTPLVDRKVVSGTDTDHRAVATLLGGRSYAIRLEFSKATQGVQEQDKSRQKPPAPAFVSLQWKRPKMAEEVIPARFLHPHWSPLRFVPSTPFPPDDRSIGYDRGTLITKEWSDAVSAASLEAAAYAFDHVDRLAGTAPDAGDRLEKIKGWSLRLNERAYRRPLAPAERTRVEALFKPGADLEEAVKKSVVMAVQSPFFLFREVEDPDHPQFATAANLSFGLWDTIPDPALAQAAASGQLSTPDQIRAQAERMADDPRAWDKLRGFYFSWLKVDAVKDLTKDKSVFPEFTAEAASDLRSSLELFLEKEGRGKEAKFPDLFLADKYPVNARVGSIYGVAVPPSAGFVSMPINPDERLGLLGHPYLLSRLAYLKTSSPIHRGVLLSRSIMGRSLRPPPSAFAPVAPDLHPSLTTRERVAMQTKARECMSCHSMINPLGFSLERFDAIGRTRDKENGKAVDSTGSYESRAGEKTMFSGPRDLAKFVAESKEARTSFVERLFHHMVKQPARAYGANRLADLGKSFDESGASIRALMIEIASATAPIKSVDQEEQLAALASNGAAPWTN